MICPAPVRKLDAVARQAMSVATVVAMIARPTQCVTKSTIFAPQIRSASIVKVMPTVPAMLIAIPVNTNVPILWTKAAPAVTITASARLDTVLKAFAVIMNVMEHAIPAN